MLPYVWSHVLPGETVAFIAFYLRRKRDCPDGVITSQPMERNTKLLKDTEIARMLEVSVATVRRWRLLNQGPRYLKLGASVRYRLEDLQEFLRNCAVSGAAMPKEVA